MSVATWTAGDRPRTPYRDTPPQVSASRSRQPYAGAASPLTVRKPVILTRALARPTVAAATLACLAALALAGCSQPATDANERPASSTTDGLGTGVHADRDGHPDRARRDAPGPRAAAPTPTETGDHRRRRTGGPARPAARPPPTSRLQRRVPLEDRRHQHPRAARARSAPASASRSRRSAPRTSPSAPSCRPAGGAGTDAAGELVAEFPDTATARRAFAVLKSWRAAVRRPAEALQAPPQVGELQDVARRRRHRRLVPPHLRPGRRATPTTPSSTPRAWPSSAPASRWCRWCWPARTTTTSRARSRWSRRPAAGGAAAPT